MSDDEVDETVATGSRSVRLRLRITNVERDCLNVLRSFFFLIPLSCPFQESGRRRRADLWSEGLVIFLAEDAQEKMMARSSRGPKRCLRWMEDGEMSPAGKDDCAVRPCENLGRNGRFAEK
jgi:hypothetical protein